jgi:hypothetical protein
MRVFVVVKAAVTALVVVQAASAAPLPVILQVQSTPLAWGDSRLPDILTTALSRNPDLNVIVPEAATRQYPPFPNDRNNIDSLLNWGTEVGGRYLLTVIVDREALERRKTFSVPLLFHRWETIAIMSGEFRLVDLLKRRLVLAEPFEEKLSVARQFQSSAEDNAADPALHVNAAEKSDLFQSLETRLTEHLVDKISRYMRGR